MLHYKLVEQNAEITPQPQLNSDQPVVNPSQKRSLMPMILILGFGVLLLAGIGGWAVSQNRGEQKKDQATQRVEPLANNTVVYGYWTTEASIINAYDLSTRTNTILATLPSNIKHLKVLSPTKVIYIKDVDARDYGTELVVRALDTQAETVVLTAEQGFGIDDYRVSPNGNFAAVWEIDPPTDSGPIRGGRSMVLTTSLTTPGQKNIIYDERTNVPVHYPVAVTDDGSVYSDRFLPNADAGWAYGMSVSDFTGSAKEDIQGMENGTYSTQPTHSPEGTKLLFAGYDGSKGSGESVTGGFRRAITNPNTIEYLDLATKARTKIAGSDEALYPSAYWDRVSGNAIYAMRSKNADESGTYSFNIPTQEEVRIDVGNTVTDAPSGVLASLQDNKLLLADESVDESTVGNLGDKYAPAIAAMYVMDAISSERIKVEQNGEMVQFIDVKGANYFSLLKDSAQAKAQKDKQIQLQTFTMKPKLAPQRLEQQSGNKCRDVAAAQCNTLHGTNFNGEEARAKATNNDEFDACFNDLFWGAGRQTLGSCTDSPLYLYGTPGTRVTVTPLTPIFSPNIPYSRGEGIDIELLTDGRFEANGKEVQSLSFDYTPALKRLSRPSYGAVVSVVEIENKALEYSRKLGLNETETRDTISFILNNVVGPYVYISFYDNTTSRNILPLHFDPQPDNYTNVVFYLENLNQPPTASIEQPIFKKVQRGGFTAVEISFIIK